jgi:hypothetical protein
VAAVLVIGVLAYLALRPTADLDHIGSSFSTGFGARALDDGAGLQRRFSGTGTVIVANSARNLRDHDVELSVPDHTREDLAGWDIGAEVLFVPLTRSGGYGDYHRESDLARGTTTMAAGADGEIVHVFRITRCLPPRTVTFASFGLQTDGHDARVEISPTTDTRELSTYEREVADNVGRIEIGGCGRF